jgi:hypothetical protein
MELGGRPANSRSLDTFVFRERTTSLARDDRLLGEQTALVPVAVPVRVGMNFAGSVGVTMGMHQPGAPQEFMVSQNFRGRAGRNDPALQKNVAEIGNVVQQIEIVSCGDHRFPPSAATHQEVDHLALAFGIQRRRWLIQQQNLGIKDQD